MSKIKLVDGTEWNATKVVEGQPYFVITLEAAGGERTLKVHADKVLWWESEQEEERGGISKRF